MPDDLAPSTGNTRKAELAALLLLALFTVVLAARQAFDPIPDTILIILFLGAISGLWGWLRKRQQKPFSLQTAALLFCMFLGIGYSLVLFGGVLSPVALFLVAIPVGGAVFVGRPFGLFMLACCGVLLGVLAFLHKLGFPFGELPFTGLGNIATTAAYAMVTATALLLVVSFDQTRRSGETRDAQSMAQTDYLTGLLNRAGFENRFMAVRQRDRRQAALLAIDIDHFKACNDTLGHDAGDRCLQAIAAALADCVGRKNDLIGRIGGDEFLALVSGVDMERALMVAEKMRNAVSDLQIFTADEPPRKITVTIGIVFLAKHSDNELNPLYKLVDKALYDGKRNGKNCVKTLESNVYSVNFR